MYEPNVVYEVTCRTIQGRYLLVPSNNMIERVAGVIGRAQFLFKSISVYAVHALSDHMTWLLSASNPAEISKFIGHVNGNISKEIGLLHDWPGKMWERRARPIPVLDDTALVARFKYLLSQGCKEGLVEAPRDWPGLTCVHALIGDRPLSGLWFDRDAEHKHKRRKGGEDKYGPLNFSSRYDVTFAKLPCWADLDDDAYEKRVRAMADTIRTETRAAFPRDTNPVLGAKAVMAFHPHYRPGTLARSPAPLCHASTRATRQEYKTRYRNFVNAFRHAAEQLKKGVVSVRFPPFAFPPRLPMASSP